MVLDGILFVLCTLAFIRGWRKGLLWAICSLLAVVLGIVIAMQLSSKLADYLFVQQVMTSQYTLLIAFVVLFLGTIFLFRMFIKVLEGILDKVFLGWVNKLLGGLLYAFFIIFIVSTFCWLGNQAKLIQPGLKESSKSYIYLESIAPKTISIVSAYLPYGKDLIQRVQTHFNQVVQ